MTSKEASTTVAPVQSRATRTVDEPAAPPDYLRRAPRLKREYQVCGYELKPQGPRLQRVRLPAALRSSTPPC